jgi:hypothetical protein
MNLILRSLVSLVFVTAWTAGAIDTTNTRLVSDPVPGASVLAFAYANDLWVPALDGSGVRRLTVHPGVESGPQLSPDGTLVAFTGRYEGNTDVYVRRRFPAATTRDDPHHARGKSVLFSSPREVYTTYPSCSRFVTGGYPAADSQHKPQSVGGSFFRSRTMETLSGGRRSPLDVATQDQAGAPAGGTRSHPPTRCGWETLSTSALPRQQRVARSTGQRGGPERGTPIPVVTPQPAEDKSPTNRAASSLLDLVRGTTSKSSWWPQSRGNAVRAPGAQSGRSASQPAFEFRGSGDRAA